MLGVRESPPEWSSLHENLHNLRDGFRNDSSKGIRVVVNGSRDGGARDQLVG